MRSLCLFLLIGLTACGSAKQECKYVPIVLDNREGLVDAPSMLDEAHLDRVEKALRYYSIEYLRIDPLVLNIHSKQWCGGNDVARDTIWNITNKANDVEWIETHKAGE